MKQHPSTVLPAPHFRRRAVAEMELTMDRLESDVRFQVREYVRDFRLELRDHGLILRGIAHTYYAKQLAQHAVMEATDYPIFSNAIAVV